MGRPRRRQLLEALDNPRAKLDLSRSAPTALDEAIEGPERGFVGGLRLIAAPCVLVQLALAREPSRRGREASVELIDQRERGVVSAPPRFDRHRGLDERDERAEPGHAFP